jgi:hypothetical protein
MVLSLTRFALAGAAGFFFSQHRIIRRMSPGAYSDKAVCHFWQKPQHSCDKKRHGFATARLTTV